VGHLNQLLGRWRPTERTWCCDRCRAAALAAEHVPDDKHAGHHGQAQQHEDKIAQAGPETIERRG
jgi:hypothetical protein